MIDMPFEFVKRNRVCVHFPPVDIYRHSWQSTIYAALRDRTAFFRIVVTWRTKTWHFRRRSRRGYESCIWKHILSRSWNCACPSGRWTALSLIQYPDEFYQAGIRSCDGPQSSISKKGTRGDWPGCGDRSHANARWPRAASIPWLHIQGDITVWSSSNPHPVLHLLWQYMQLESPCPSQYVKPNNLTSICWWQTSTGIPHRVEKEDSYNGMRIPLGATIMPNIWYGLSVCQILCVR